MESTRRRREGDNVPVDLIDLLTKELSSRTPLIAAALAEPEPETRAALAALATALVAALTCKGAGAAGAAELLEMAPTGAAQPRRPAADGTRQAGRELTHLRLQGAPLVTRLFDGRQAPVADWLASRSGVRPRSAMSLLALGAPLLLGLVVSAAQRAGGLDLPALRTMLAEQRARFAGAAPAGLAEALGLAAASELSDPPDDPTPPWWARTSWLILLLVPCLVLLGRWCASLW